VQFHQSYTMAAQEMSFEGGVISMEGCSFMATDKQLA
jgi:hypothetical protein